MWARCIIFKLGLEQPAPGEADFTFCYTLQLVSHEFEFHDQKLCNVSCDLSRNLSSGLDLVLSSEFQLAVQQKYCETSC